MVVVSLESHYYGRKKKSLCEATVTWQRQWLPRSGGLRFFYFVTARTAGVSCLFLWYKCADRTDALLDGKKLLPFLFFYFCVFFPPPALADPRGSDTLIASQASEAPATAHLAGGLRPCPLPSICTGEHPTDLFINPSGISTGLDDHTSNTACPKVKQPSAPKHASLTITSQSPWNPPPVLPSPRSESVVLT